jgi:glycosyltransferase involved in cell wall biosynthesis
MSLFSVIVPIHNRAHLIGECLDSILAQNFQDFEVILVDNNSSDDLEGALRNYSDPRIRLTHCSTPGPSAARNHGISLSTGKYLSFIDSDDLWRSDVLEKVASMLDSPTRPEVVYLSLVLFRTGSPVEWDSKPASEVIFVKNILDALWIGAPGAGALAGVRREFFENGQEFSPELWIGEDLDWALRHATLGPVCMLHDKPRLGYRRHDENTTKDANRYEIWASQLLGFARDGRYEIRDQPHLKRYIIAHLMGQLNTLICASGISPCFRLYPRIFMLGIQWGIWKPLFMLDLLNAYFGKRIRQAKSVFTGQQ